LFSAPRALDALGALMIAHILPKFEVFAALPRKKAGTWKFFSHQ